MEIKHPEWLQVKSDSSNLYGYDQRWYKTSFQRTRGCGPTAATMLLSYLSKREGDPLPYQCESIPAITKALEEVWSYVTPGWLLGLNSTEKFCKGVEELLGHYGLRWRWHKLSVTAARFKRPLLSQVVAFIEDGLASDCPIAFLNLDRGKATTLQSWHWIVLISLSLDTNQGRYMATCYDGGRSITFDLGSWLKTTKLGGGFVFLSVD